MNRHVLFSFAVAAGLGAAIWGLSPLVAEAAEPWDAESPYYFISLFVAGGVVGLACPRHILATFLGLIFGEMVYMLVVLPSGPLLPLGVLFMFGYGLVSLLGLFLGSSVRRTVCSIGAGKVDGT